MSVRKIKKNEWFLDVRVWVNRKEFRKRKRFVGSRKEALFQEACLRNDLKGQGNNSKKDLCENFSDILSCYVQMRGVVPSKQITNINRLKRDLGKVSLREFPERFEKYVSLIRFTNCEKTGKPLKNPSINRIISLVRCAFNVAIHMEKIEQNPITSKRFPKLVETPRDRILSNFEKTHLMNVLAQDYPHLEPLVKYALQVPCRKSELVNMKATDLDLFENVIRVHNGTTKTGKGIWKPIPPNMISYFRSLPAKAEYLFFRQDKGAYNSLGDFKTAWRNALKKAGIVNYRFHDTRHQAATEMVNNGTPEQVVNEIAGWSPGSNMLKTYYNLGGKSSMKFIKFKAETGQVDRTLESVMAVNG